MDFLRCVINGTRYGTGDTDVSASNANLSQNIREGDEASQSAAFQRVLLETYKNPYFRAKRFHDVNLVYDMVGNTEQKARIEFFFTILALCHTIPSPIPDRVEGLLYNSQSPDECKCY
jgi:hypothetical protein